MRSPKNNPWSRFLIQIFELNMLGLAVVAPILFIAALLGLTGHLPDGSSLSMLGREVESNADYHAFMASTAAFGLIGWLYVWLRLSGRLRFVALRKSTETEKHDKPCEETGENSPG